MMYGNREMGKERERDEEKNELKRKFQILDGIFSDKIEFLMMQNVCTFIFMILRSYDF